MTSLAHPTLLFEVIETKLTFFIPHGGSDGGSRCRDFFLSGWFGHFLKLRVRFREVVGGVSPWTSTVEGEEIFWVSSGVSP